MAGLMSRCRGPTAALLCLSVTDSGANLIDSKELRHVKDYLQCWVITIDMVTEYESS